MKKIIKILLSVLFFIYIAVLLKITVFRSAFGLYRPFSNGSVNMTFFKGYMVFVRSKSWFRLIYLFVGNIVWFIPFGMYLQYLMKNKSILLSVFCGMLFSAGIETLQYIFGTGITELDDVILNTFGAFIGAISVKLFYKFRRR